MNKSAHLVALLDIREAPPKVAFVILCSEPTPTVPLVFFTFPVIDAQGETFEHAVAKLKFALHVPGHRKMTDWVIPLLDEVTRQRLGVSS